MYHYDDESETWTCDRCGEVIVRGKDEDPTVELELHSEVCKEQQQQDRIDKANFKAGD